MNSNGNVGEKKEKLEPQIKSVDMSEDMQSEAIEVSQEAMEKYNIEKVVLRPPGLHEQQS